MEQMRERILHIIATQLRVEAADLTPQTRFVDDLGVDSIDFIEMIMYLEKDFGVKLADSQVKRLRSVEDVIESVSGAMRV